MRCRPDRARARGPALALLLAAAAPAFGAPKPDPAARVAAPSPAASGRTAPPIAPPAPASGPTFDLGDGLRGGARAGRLEVWTTARKGEGWLALARRASADAARWKELAGGRADAPLREGQEVVVPRALWRPGLGLRLLERLFPADRVTGDGRVHVVTRGETLGFAESPWSLAALFLGDGRLHARLGIDEAARARGLRPGDRVQVPGDLLLPCWRGAAPKAPATAVAAATRPQRMPAPASTTASAPPPGAPPLRGTREGAPPRVEPAAPAGGSAAAPGSDGDAGPLSLPGRPAAADGASRVTLEGTGGLQSDAAGTLAISRPGGTADATRQASAGSKPPPAEPRGPEPAGVRPGQPADDDEADGDDDADAPGMPLPPADDDDEFLPAREPPSDAAGDTFPVVPGTRSADGVLTYALDAQGPHAVYRLGRGETLYTHVVLRFTGLLSGKDVNDAAQRFARRSRVADVTQIRVGTPIRIPLADLTPAFLPEGHPRRVRWQQEQAESARLAKRERRRNLEGVHVLVDAGHGGLDPGAGTTRVWEDDYAYDVACRVMAALQERTQAQAHPLVHDLSSGHAPLSRLKRDTDEVLLTTPRFEMQKWSARSAVNLRWILANALRRKLVASGVPDDRILFLSFHADSLHESATGSMVYYASAQYRPPASGLPAEPAYRGLQEAVAENGFEMSRRDMLRSEGLSRALGESIVAALRAEGLGVHGFSPVRGSIVRSGTWVPAVLKLNRVQAAVLVEACNLNNPEDQKRLRDPSFRQAFAEAVVSGLEEYFDGKGSSGDGASGRARAAR